MFQNFVSPGKQHTTQCSFHENPNVFIGHRLKFFSDCYREQRKTRTLLRDCVP